jgi:hypothetical protein
LQGDAALEVGQVGRVVDQEQVAGLVQVNVLADGCAPSAAVRR